MTQWSPPPRGEITKMDVRQLRNLANRFSNEYEQLRTTHLQEVLHHNAQRKLREQYYEANTELTKRVEGLKDEVLQLEDRIKTQEATIKTLMESNAALGERLEKADKRIGQALNTAEDAAAAAGAIARVTNSLGVCLDTLEVRLELDNKELVRRFRG